VISFESFGEKNSNLFGKRSWMADFKMEVENGKDSLPKIFLMKIVRNKKFISHEHPSFQSSFET